MRTLTLLFIVSIFAFFSSCKEKNLKLFVPVHPEIRYAGRIDFSDEMEPVLIGSASYVEAAFVGDSCQIMIRKLNPNPEPNYISIELDGEDLGRIRLDSATQKAFTFHAAQNSEHHIIKVFKSTEAANNYVAYGGILCKDLKPLPSLPSKKIEFIGNSITCGMGNDLSDIPCNTGLWYDQHNAYWAYGPIVAREIDAQWMLSSVSGIGVYRNWNSEGPVMPDVYENLFLNTDESKKWDFETYIPDLVSICLGTNDMSDGDGSYDRLPFDSANYVGAYIDFIKLIYDKYTETQVCLLNSPMVKNEKGMLLTNCLEAVAAEINGQYPDRKTIQVFRFPEDIEPHGCDYHPDIEDHKQMAKALVPFYKELMGW